MTYEVLDIDSGDVLALYASFEDAQVQLAAHLEEHPDETDELGIATINDDGVVYEITPAEMAFAA